MVGKWFYLALYLRPVHLRKYIFLNTISPIRKFTQLTRKLSKMYSRYFASNPNVNFVFAYRKVIFIITQPIVKVTRYLNSNSVYFSMKKPKIWLAATCPSDTCHSGHLPCDSCHSETVAIRTLAIRRHLPFGQLPFEDTCPSDSCHSGHLPFWDFPFWDLH